MPVGGAGSIIEMMGRSLTLGKPTIARPLVVLPKNESRGARRKLSELDDKFGPAIAPQNGWKSWERGEQLLCYELNQASAKQLSGLLATAKEGGIQLNVALAVTVIWAVTEAGDVAFALEETIVVDGTSRRPRMRGVPLNGNVKPLGHPLLVGGASARIAGELYLDLKEGGDDLVWVMNNRSGRYGMHKSRNLEHLENVAELLRRHGLEVQTEFFEVTT